MSSEGLTPRVGWGFDAHRFDENPPVLLGGVVVSEEVGVAATSDGDVLAHAVSDALLGAAALGDLGEHFPAEDPASEGADSMELLSRVRARVADTGWAPAQVDVTVAAEGIRVAPHREAIRARLAETLGLEAGSVSVKATSTDGMGFIGRGEGIACVAVVTVVALS
ncbi:MAG: 2-C-methyl-D-erythritol 2,4-cyclodiphosphate synthase [Acidimicrobiia bacterium]